jgi:excisionase family DNA binding protein
VSAIDRPLSAVQAELLGAIGSREGRELLADILAPTVTTAVRQALDAREAPALPVQEAAKRLGLSVPTIWRRVRAGELQTIRVGRSVRVVLPAPSTAVEVRALARAARRR